MDMATGWFAVLAFFWIGYVVLDGFDLGVGMHMRLLARDERERRALLNTIGPVWDGNEVWLVSAGAATFAAFPFWYAALFSGLYVPLTVILLCLIARAVSIEYRGKLDSNAWRATWTTAMAVSSAGAAFLIGTILATTSFGLPLDSNGDVVGGAFAWLSWPAVLGGVALVGFCLVHGLAFLALKTTGELRRRSTRLLARWAVPGLLPLAVWALLMQVRSGSAVGWVLFFVAAAAVVFVVTNAIRERDGWAFTGMVVFLVSGFASVFTAMYPVVLPSTLDHSWDLTVANASVSEYTLGVLTVVGLLGIPILLVYQGWTYWVFRKRVSAGSIPAPHNVLTIARQLNRAPSGAAAAEAGNASSEQK